MAILLRGPRQALIRLDPYVHHYAMPRHRFWYKVYSGVNVHLEVNHTSRDSKPIPIPPPQLLLLNGFQPASAKPVLLTFRDLGSARTWGLSLLLLPLHQNQILIKPCRAHTVRAAHSFASWLFAALLRSQQQQTSPDDKLRRIGGKIIH